HSLYVRVAFVGSEAGHLVAELAELLQVAPGHARENRRVESAAIRVADRMWGGEVGIGKHLAIDLLGRREVLPHDRELLFCRRWRVVSRGERGADGGVVDHAVRL